MRFENIDYTARRKFSRLIVMIITGILVICTAMLVKNPIVLAGLIAIILLAFTVFNITRYKRKLNYIYYCDEWNKITLRFYHIVMFSKKYKTYEIPTNEFYKYEIVTIEGRKELVLFKREGNKILKFPSVSLSALRDDEIISITNSLDSFKKQ